MKKVSTGIKKVTIDSPVFSGEVFEPTLINFFFGKNGTGKSTIAKEMGKSGSVEWCADNQGDYEVLIYNEEYIQENVQSYGNIPGVFTITKQNAQIKADVDKKTSEARELSVKASEASCAATDAENNLNAEKQRFEKDLWIKTEEYRKKYSLALKGFNNSKNKFAAELMKKSAVNVDESKLQVLYDTVYGNDVARYAEYLLVSVESIPTFSLLEKPIVSSSDTVFSAFLKALNATAWVTHGHREYQHLAGEKCPYCQQTLPDNFESELASCFDEQYRKEKEEVERFAEEYRNALLKIYAIAKQNLANGFACVLIDSYKTKYELFTEKAKANVELIKQKAADPSIVVSVESLSEIIQELNEIAEQVNLLIRQNNAVVDDKPAKKKECDAMVWSLLAFTCQTEIALYQQKENNAKADILRFQARAARYSQQVEGLQNKIVELNKSTVNTTAAKDSINALIRSSGFQGFQLREKPRAQYVYQLVREDGSIAKGLSEGERHFIAFLYFYHTVMGSQSDDGKRREKIVIIDDPVSSMDSGAMFTVSILVREMIAICYNNYDMTEEAKDDYIKQFFCLTHNPYFFKEIVYNRVSAYECINIYEIRKQENNHSLIEKCERNRSRTGSEKENYSPVKNTYDALWSEFKTSEDTNTLLNISRQILEYYFLQICGYKNGNLRSDLLEKHSDEFITKRDDGSVDNTKYMLVSAMIAALNVGALGFNDGLYFDTSSLDAVQLKESFRTIFDILGQVQHYNMMMGLT